MLENETSEFINKTKKSRIYFERARKVIPGGVAANIKYFPPYPITMEKGHGSKLYDLDGNEYIDYLLCNGALIFGHGYPEIISAVEAQMETTGTTIFGTPHCLEARMAEKIIEFFPSMESVRFTNSGTEATLLATRLAFAYTGKPKIAKFEGHYHGGFDRVLISVNPDISEAGQESSPNAIPDSKGIPDYYVKNTVILPFNDYEATEKILRERSDEIGALIMEPVLGGFIPADKLFMEKLRVLTNQLNIVLIMDEVKTGFRMLSGSVQGEFNIKPDITTLGKVLGGGFPIGAVGGKKEIMNMLSPTNGADILAGESKSKNKTDILFHSGTYNGHPVVLKAGLATITELEKKDVMKNLIDHTMLLRKKLEAVYRKHGIPMQTIGMGSIFNVILTEHPVHNYRDMAYANMNLRKQIDYKLLELGIYVKPLTRYSMSCVHDIDDINKTVEAHEIALSYFS